MVGYEAYWGPTLYGCIGFHGSWGEYIRNEADAISAPLGNVLKGKSKMVSSV